MIKFQFFEKANSLSCHFNSLGTFVVSIAHYMRAYFNYEALTQGTDFQLPNDAAYLNCVKLKESEYLNYPLYAKIGCQHRDTYTSTKLQLILYTDAQCSQEYEDDEMTKDGYYVGDYFMSNKVSFRPPFYSCQTCHPDQVSATFSKSTTAWYDDEYISKHGKKNDGYNYDNGEEGDEQVQYGDDGGYYVKGDDFTMDGQQGNDGNNYYVAQDDQVQYNYRAHNDDNFYQNVDDGRMLRKVEAKEDIVDASQSLTAKMMRKVRLDFSFFFSGTVMSMCTR